MSKQTLTDNAATKAAAQSLLRAGLATYSELSELSGKSRQTIRYWANELAAESARQDHLEKLWRDTLRRNALEAKHAFRDNGVALWKRPSRAVRLKPE
jgi:hypothetical protein